MNWKKQVKRIILKEELSKTSISIKRAELINKIYMDGQGVVGFLDDFLDKNTIEALPFFSRQPAIAMNFNTYNGHIQGSKQDIFPEDIILERKFLKLGYFAKHKNIPIIITNIKL